jgi:hypothetical protein
MANENETTDQALVETNDKVKKVRARDDVKEAAAGKETKPAPKQEDGKAKTTRITRVQGLINREAGVSIPFDVPDYELPVLEELHGAASIVVHSETDDDVDFNAAEAHASLMKKYNQHTDVVRGVFRDARSLARESGLPLSKYDEKAAKANQNVEYVGGVKQEPGTTSKAGTGADESDDERYQRQVEERQKARLQAEKDSGG